MPRWNFQVTARSDLALSIATVPDMGGDAEASWLIWSEQMRASFLPLVPRTGVRDPMNVLYSLASNPETAASNSKQAMHI